MLLMTTDTTDTTDIALVLAFDLSNHQGPLTEAQARAAWAKGYRRAIINMYGPYAVQQAEMCAYVGFELQAYWYLNFPGGEYYTGVSAYDQITYALNKCALTGLTFTFIWLDCEDPGNNLNAPDTIAFIEDAARACINRMWSGIYTAKGWWQQFTDDTTAFAAFLLWLATDDKLGDLLSSQLPFGGWLACAMEQYDFHGDIDDALTDVEFDVNVYRQPVMRGPVPADPTDPVPTPDAASTNDVVSPPLNLTEDDTMTGFIRIEGTKNIEDSNEALAATLGPLIGNPSSPIRAFLRRNVDGTFDYMITNIPESSGLGDTPGL